MTTYQCDVAVIGAGASGLSAAVHCAERGASVICLEQAPLPGGLVVNVGRIDGFPAPGELSGAALIDGLSQRCQQLQVQILNAEVTGMEQTGGRHVLATAAGPVAAQRVIVASGARLRQLGVPGESELAGRGVSQCDWCDGGFFRNEAVAVVGGGDAAFQAALHLSAMCDSVTLIMRSAAMRARRSYVEAAGEQPRIAFLWETTVERIVGQDKVEALLLKDHSDGSVMEHPAAGVFVFIGTEPNSQFLPPTVQRDALQCVVTDADLRTTAAGIFAVGAVRSGYRGQLVSACGEGVTAAVAVMEELDRLAG